MMVADAARGIAGLTVLVTADTDLAPALEAVRLVAPQQKIYLAMPPGNTKPSEHLTAVGNIGYFRINEAALRGAHLPEAVARPGGGRPLRRPPKWS
ncbi:hypothetical protein [Actinoplanes sp. TFC3]|uniref:hypothetical protein n=1 Tax=Actinoplanes sp. TFC3 TaxID=1710355 RepID=UPI00083257CF|nr:hypothetical protein [Actinoplanes sp. TFC3]